MRNRLKTVVCPRFSAWLYKKIPRDDEHVQPGEYFAKKQATDFHLTAKGYGVLATQLKPLVVKIIKEKGF